jgi:hypothetical protein
MRGIASRWVGAVATVAAAVTGAAVAPQPPGAVIVVDPANRPAIFAAGELRTAFEARGIRVTTAVVADLPRQTAPVQVVITTANSPVADRPGVSGLQPQGYAIRRVAAGPVTRWWAVGDDDPGAMYAGLELAEDVRINGGLAGTVDRQVNPAIVSRGIKFNIPLDARTPSYSDDSTSAQANVAEMWSMDFWTSLLDDMARHRYNLLSLWSLSPFPSLVRVPEYPKVALADVKKKAGALWDATLQGRGMYDPSWALDTVKTMTVDDKIAFWRRVMQYAHDRGVDVSLFTWNIFVYGTETSGYGITDSPTNAITRDYVRRSVRTVFDTYPLLASIGVTSGENMGGLDDAGKEEWMWATYGQGVADAMADAKDPSSPYYQPTRVIRLIHRAHQADLSKIVAEFRRLPGYDDVDSTLAFSFKYSQAHMYASTSPQFIYQNHWFDTIPAGKKTWLTIRNDDMYGLRWGDPAFARAYLAHFPDMSKVGGFYMGPDGYTWGRDYLSRAPAATPPPTVMAKQWYSFLIWGRLAYEPALPDSRLERILAARYPEVSAATLFAAWASASRVFATITRFYWGSLDFMWYPEASWSNTGYAGVEDLITPKYPPMRADEDGDTPRFMSVKAFVDGESPAGRLTPLDVADRLDANAATAEANLQGIGTVRDDELTRTIEDIRAMTMLGRYYAEKIRGAVGVAKWRASHDAADARMARQHLVASATYWREYASSRSARTVPQGLTRMGLTPVDVVAIQRFVDRDITLAPAP